MHIHEHQNAKPGHEMLQAATQRSHQRSGRCEKLGRRVEWQRAARILGQCLRSHSRRQQRKIMENIYIYIHIMINIYISDYISVYHSVLVSLDFR